MPGFQRRLLRAASGEELVSGGWYSRWAPPERMDPTFRPLTDSGFTVFAVRHGSSPKFSNPEVVQDVRRSVRYIRCNATAHQVDSIRLGGYGFSADGHLSLVLGTTADEGDPAAQDPILQVSDRVQAVVAWVAPTDLRRMVWTAPERLPAYERIPALDLKLEAARKFSPLVYVMLDDAPALLIVGDQDQLVPMKHRQEIHTALQKSNVAAQMIVLEGARHGFSGKHAERAVQETVTWFQKHLAVRNDEQWFPQQDITVGLSCHWQPGFPHSFLPALRCGDGTGCHLHTEFRE